MGRDDIYPVETSKVGSLLHYVIAYLGLLNRLWHTDLGLLYWIYTIPTHYMYQWLILQFMYSWWWTRWTSETCRVFLQLLINNIAKFASSWFLIKYKNIFSSDFLWTQMFAKEIRLNEYLFVGNKCLISSKYSFITKCVSLCLIPPAFYAEYGLYIVTRSLRERGRKRQLPVSGQTVLNVTMCVPECASPNTHSNKSLYFHSFQRS
jgi:hypothetical protein